MVHKLPNLPYSYDALEPYIDEATMKLHHTKHHQTYIDNLNKALTDKLDLQNFSVEELLANIDKVPDEIKQAIANHGGGHANHTFFWKIMTPEKTEPSGSLKSAIDSEFGSIDKFTDEFKEKALGVFGSGWAFLVLSRNKKLQLKRQSFQNSPLMSGNTPIIGIDVWEHAYYLKYQNRRAEYIDAFLSVLNWKQAEENFVRASK